MYGTSSYLHGEKQDDGTQEEHLDWPDERSGENFAFGQWALHLTPQLVISSLLSQPFRLCRQNRRCICLLQEHQREN